MISTLGSRITVTRREDDGSTSNESRRKVGAVIAERSRMSRDRAVSSPVHRRTSRSTGRGHRRMTAERYRSAGRLQGAEGRRGGPRGGGRHGGAGWDRPAVTGPGDVVAGDVREGDRVHVGPGPSCKPGASRIAD